MHQVRLPFREDVLCGPVELEDTVLHDCIYMARRFGGLTLWDALAHEKSARGVRVQRRHDAFANLGCLPGLGGSVPNVVAADGRAPPPTQLRIRSGRVAAIRTARSDPQSCPTRSIGCGSPSNVAASQATYSSFVAPKPGGTALPKPGNERLTTSERLMRSKIERQTRSVSGTPWIKTTGIETPRCNHINRNSLPLCSREHRSSKSKVQAPRRIARCHFTLVKRS